MSSAYTRVCQHHHLSPSMMSAKWTKPRNTMPSLSNREKMLRKPCKPCPSTLVVAHQSIRDFAAEHVPSVRHRPPQGIAQTSGLLEHEQKAFSSGYRRAYSERKIQMCYS